MAKENPPPLSNTLSGEGSSCSLVRIPEIAEALRVERRTVERRAKNGRPKSGEPPWPAQLETVQGGRRKVFSLSDVPSDVQEAVLKRRKEESARKLLEEPSSQTAQLDLLGQATEQQTGLATSKQDRAAIEARKLKEEGLKRFAVLPKDSDKHKRAKAREWLVLKVLQYRQQHGAGVAASRRAIVEAVNTHSVTVPDDVIQWIPMRGGVRKLTEKTLENWSLAYKKQGIWGLTDGYGTRKGQSKIASDPALQKAVLGCMIQHPHIKAIQVVQYLQAAHSELAQPSLRSIQRFMKEWKDDNAQQWTYMTDPDRWKNGYMSAAGSHFENIKALNQLWEMDSTPGDWMLKDGRHSVIGVIDLYSRRLKLYVSKTSKAQAVCQLFRRAVLDWGVPEIVRIDNGKDYTSEQFTGVLRDLEIERELCTPFASEEKGTIERALKTMSHGILELLTGFIGHNVAERQRIEARKSFADRVMKRNEVVEVELTSQDLQLKLDQWVDHVYSHNAHSGLNGQTPFEMFTNWTGSIRRIGDERALDMLLAEIAAERSITKKGIRFNNNDYFNDSLFEYVGKRALLKYDEQNLGHLYAYIDGKFVGTVTCHALIGISRQEAAAAAKAKQKKLMAEQARELKEQNRLDKKDIAGVVLDYRIEQSANLTAFPKRSEAYSSAGLKEAAEAALTDSQPRSERTTSANKKSCSAADQKPNKDTPKAENTVISFGTDEQKYRRWLELDKKVKTGEEISDQRLNKFYLNFPKTPGFEVQKEMAEMRRQLQKQAKA